MFVWQFVCFHSYFSVANYELCVVPPFTTIAMPVNYLGLYSTLTYKIYPVLPYVFASELISLRRGREDQTIMISSYFDVSVTEKESKALLPNPSHLEP